MMTDGATLGNGGSIEAGWWVDDVKVGGVLVSDGTLAGWGTEAPPIAGYTLQLVSIDARHGKQATLARVPLKTGARHSLRRRSSGRLLGRRGRDGGVLVMYDEPTESIARYAPYSLKVNGVSSPEVDPSRSAGTRSAGPSRTTGSNCRIARLPRVPTARMVTGAQGSRRSRKRALNVPLRRAIKGTIAGWCLPSPSAGPAHEGRSRDRARRPGLSSGAAARHALAALRVRGARTQAQAEDQGGGSGAHFFLLRT